MNTITTQQIIEERQKELINEVQDLEQLIRNKQLELESLIQLRDRRIMEHDILDRVPRADMFSMREGEVTRSRLTFEDCLKLIFEHAGRPVRMTELIDALETYNYKWSNYATAYNYITRTPHVENVARGYYQLRR